MRQLRRRIALAIGCAVVIGMGGAGSASARPISPAATCSVTVAPLNSGGTVVSARHTASCNTRVPSIRVYGFLSGPGGTTSKTASCTNCTIVSVTTSAPYASGTWFASTDGFAGPYEPYTDTTFVVP